MIAHIVSSALALALLIGATSHPSEQAEAKEPAAQSERAQSPKPIPANVPSPVQQVQPQPKQPPCGPETYGSSDDLCAQWKAADAAADAAFWAKIGAFLSIAAIVGVFVTFRESQKSNKIARDDLTRQRPPELRLQNIWIDVEGDESPVWFRPGQTIKGSGYVSNVGWDRARISWSDTAGNGDRRSSQCIAVFHNGLLPMKRFAAEEREERFAHNQIPCTSIDVGEFAEWQFEATVPDDWCPKRGNLYVTGFIVYWGSVGNRRATHFCRRYCVKERRFVPVENHPEYESIE